jgi:phosphopantetheine adenylyltransferase
VKQVHQLGGDVSGLVPAIVHRALIRKMPKG